MSDVLSNPSQTGHIGIRLLGQPTIEARDDARAMPVKGYQLLAYLVLSPGMRASRRNAAEILWETKDGEIPFDNLRQLLARVKRALSGEDPVLRSDGREVWIEDRAWRIDLARLTADEGAAALELYRGPLLEGIGGVSERFHDWLLIERLRLEDWFFDAVRRRLREVTWHGAARRQELDGLAAALLRVDPEREESYRVLREAYARANLAGEAARLDRLRAAVMEGHGDPQAGLHRENAPEEVVRGVDGRSDAPHVAARVRADVEGPAPGAADPVVPRISFLKPKWVAGDRRDEPLLDMLIEDVANELSRFRTFSMLAPYSTYQLGDEWGMQLGGCPFQSDYQISGLVKPEQRLSLRLTRLATSEIVWAGEFSVAREALLSSFSTLCRLVAQELSAGIERELARTFAKPASAGAYGSYLLGQSAMRECKLPQLRRARKHFHAAGTEAPRFAPAQARLAQTLYQEWLLLGGDDPERLNEANRRARRAVDVDANDGLSQWINGVIALYRREFDRSEEHFELAETLAPNSPDLLVQFGDALSHLARPAEGMKKFDRALELNPRPPEHYWWVGASIAMGTEDYSQAIAYCSRLQDDESVVRILAAAHALNGDLREARHYARRVRELYPNVELDDMVRLVPDKDPSLTERFKEGLRLAGI